MDRAEMHTEFKFLMDKADSSAAPIFLATEIDRLLNIAVEKFISKRAFGNNVRRTGFEEDQKRRDDLRTLITEVSIDIDEAEDAVGGLTDEGEDRYILTQKPNSFKAPLPSDYRHAINEECLIGSLRVGVKPITHDRYNKIIDDPFNTPSKTTVYKLESGRIGSTDFVELIFSSDSKIAISGAQYRLRYLRNPAVIGPAIESTTDTPDSSTEAVNCDLADHTHREIVRMAVVDALETIEQPRYESSKIQLDELE